MSKQPSIHKPTSTAAQRSFVGTYTHAVFAALHRWTTLTAPSTGGALWMLDVKRLEVFSKDYARVTPVVVAAHATRLCKALAELAEALRVEDDYFHVPRRRIFRHRRHAD